MKKLTLILGVLAASNLANALGEDVPAEVLELQPGDIACREYADDNEHEMFVRQVEGSDQYKMYIPEEEGKTLVLDCSLSIAQGAQSEDPLNRDLPDIYNCEGSIYAPRGEVASELELSEEEMDQMIENKELETNLDGDIKMGDQSIELTVRDGDDQSQAVLQQVLVPALQEKDDEDGEDPETHEQTCETVSSVIVFPSEDEPAQ